MAAEPIATEESPSTVVPDRARGSAAWGLAGELMGRDRSGRFRDLRPRVGEDGSIEWQVPPAAGPGPSPEELAEVERLKPEFLEALRGKGVAVPRPSSPTIATGGDPGPFAPKVPPVERAGVRAGIARMRLEGATNRDVLGVARSLVAALGPHEDQDRTVALFHCWCDRIRRGDLPEAILQEAFEAACGRKVEHRGKLFVHRVKQSVSEQDVRGSSPARSSP